jgi:hypothetical protein
MYRAASNTSNAEINTPGQEFVVADGLKRPSVQQEEKAPGSESSRYKSERLHFGSLNRRCAIINASDFCDLYAVLKFSRKDFELKTVRVVAGFSPCSAITAKIL